ncbi:MAG: heavy metal-binding domain-containing protein [Burkholderiales bacterium]
MNDTANRQHHPHHGAHDHAAPEHDATHVPRQPVQPAAQGTLYTCPMHPEIVRDAPGSCPICGMALVPIAGTGEADDRELRDLTKRFWLGAILTVPLVFLAMAPMFGYPEPLGLAPRTRGWVEFAIGSPVVLWVGWPNLHKFWM